MLHFQRRFIKISWDETIQAVVAEWLAYAEGIEIREALDAGYELLVQKRARRWLADTRNIAPLTPEDQSWINDDWFPRAIRAGLRRMAVIAPRKVVAQLSVKRILSRVNDKEFISMYFDTLEEGRAWLGRRITEVG